MILVYFAASLEAAVGLLLIVGPSFVAEALYGTDLSEPGLALARFAGTVFIAFAVACWPEGGTGRRSPAALRGLLTYNLLATLYFLFVGRPTGRHGAVAGVRAACGADDVAASRLAHGRCFANALNENCVHRPHRHEAYPLSRPNRASGALRKH